MEIIKLRCTIGKKEFGIEQIMVFNDCVNIRLFKECIIRKVFATLEKMVIEAKT